MDPLDPAQYGVGFGEIIVYFERLERRRHRLRHQLSRPFFSAERHITVRQTCVGWGIVRVFRYGLLKIFYGFAQPVFGLLIAARLRSSY